MITMSELIKDPTYRKFLETAPKLPKIMRDQAKQKSGPWVVYAQKEQGGKWGKKEFWKYSEAFHFFRRVMKAGFYDATINCKRLGFEPPKKRVRVRGKYVTGSDGVERQAEALIDWRPKLFPEDGEHHWCKYCRRPTIFKNYSKHPRLGAVDSFVPRCCICGASARIALTSNDKLYRF